MTNAVVPKPFIRTYVFEDHDHIYLEKISPQHARSLVKKGPHFQDMTYLQRGGAGEVIINGVNYGEQFLNNKYAVRVADSRWGGERWVYRSDNNYILTAPQIRSGDSPR